MAEIGRWGSHKFEVSPDVILGFTGLTVKGSSETEDKTASSQKYVSRKNGKPTEVSLTVGLNAQLGCDVRAEAMKFVNEARDGSKDYFYVGNAKLVTCQLMLTDATVDEVEIASGGTWARASVKLTMKQCSKNDGSAATGSSGSSGSSGSKKASTKSTSTKTTSTSSTASTTLAGAIKGAVTGLVATVKTGLSAAQKFISDTVKKAQSTSTAAKKVTATKKATTTSKNCVITTKKITRVGTTPKINLNVK